MDIKELAIAFHHSKLRLSEQENNLLLVHKLVSDLAKDEQTFDLELEIKGLNKEIKIQDALIEQRKAEINSFESDILDLIKDKAVDEKVPVFIEDASFVELFRNNKNSLSYSGPFTKA